MLNANNQFTKLFIYAFLLFNFFVYMCIHLSYWSKSILYEPNENMFVL